jgi:predicted aspartyl protease
MKTHSFKRKSPDSLIVVPCYVGYDKLALALDTGASHTTLDLTPLLIAGYEMKDAIRTEQIETASGVIEAHVFVVKEFSSLDIRRQNIEICAYDFLAYHLITDFDGVLGLDFFENIKFCIDMQHNVITTLK